MGAFIQTQNSFAAGIIDPGFLGRSDGASNGLSELVNMDVLPSCGICRRAGTARLFDAPAGANLIPFRVSDSEQYLLMLAAGSIMIYDDNELINAIIAPWATDELQSVQYAQRFGTMIFVHPNHLPQILQKNADGTFGLSDFIFLANDDKSVNIPFIKFDDAAKITLSLTQNTNGPTFATITTNLAFWRPEHVGARLLFIDKQWLITAYTNATTITAQTTGTWTATDAPIGDWREAAFSSARGWPRSITFHQDRLVFGGSRDWPCGVWMSKTGDHNNFDVGTGLDDEAIFLTLLSSSQQQICTVHSADNLQILTTAGEWAITSKPLTPSTLDIKQHTSIGSRADRYIEPQNMDGATAFVSRSGADIRELVLDELGENYNAVNLCARAACVMHSPIDMAYDAITHRLFVVMSDGTMSVFTNMPDLSIAAWAVYKTAGEFTSVAVMNDSVYVIVRRDIGTFVERFDATLPNDSGGYGFSVSAAAMPLFASGHNPKKIHLTKITARVMQTKAVDFVIGAQILHAPIPNAVMAADSDGFTGDTGVSLLGTRAYTMDPLWRIASSVSQPLTILSITTEGRYEI